MKQVNTMDAMIIRTITTFMVMQRDLYASTMKQDDPEIAKSQATYETANLAISTIAKFICNIGHDDKLPEPIATAMAQMHDAICEVGDNLLRAKGYKPEEF